MKTNKKIETQWHPFASSTPIRYTLSIPKGTRVIKLDINRYVIDSFEWIKDNSFLMHDATHYGIPINKEDIDFEGEEK